MKLFFLGVFFSLLSGCASYHDKGHAPSKSSSAKASGISKTIKKSENAAVWELLQQEKVILYFSSVDNGSRLNVILRNGLNFKNLPKGHWELTGFSTGGKTFNSLNTTKKFVVRKNDENIYGGSIVIGCPTVNRTKFSLLKSMRFFNRYSFSSGKNLCELVVGNDLAGVKTKIAKSRKNNNLSISPGF